MLSRFNKRWLLLCLIILIALVISACGSDEAISDNNIRDIEATNTPVAHTTPTPVPATDLNDPVAVDWTQTTDFAPAMRDEYVSDIDDWVDGNRYYIEASVEFTETAGVINGAQRVRYVNKSTDTLDQIVFRLYANLPVYGGRMRVTEVKVNDAVADFETVERNTSVIVHLPAPIAPGEATELMMKFILVAERGFAGSRYAHFGFEHDVMVTPEWYPVIAPYDPEDGWFVARKDEPLGDSVYSETALYDVQLTHPNNMIVAISGVTIEENENADGTITRHVVTGPMRDSMLIISPILGKITENVHGTDVNVYFWPGDERGAEYALDIAANAMRIYDEQFGDYPFAELDVVETFTISGVEFPGVIIINDNNWDAGNNGMEITIAHEVAHQWWYSVVGNDQIRYGWVDESLTSYSESVYLRNAYESQERYTDWVAQNRAIYNGYRGAPGNSDPIMNLATDQYVNATEWGVAHYNKGRVFYDTLEERIGTEAFFEAVRNYYQDMKYQVSEPIDILTHFEAASGQDLDDFFLEWIGPFEGYNPDDTTSTANDEPSITILG